jgi:hypothetical protein
VAAADGLKAARQRLSGQGSIQSRKQRIKTANKDRKIQKIQKNTENTEKYRKYRAENETEKRGQ